MHRQVDLVWMPGLSPRWMGLDILAHLKGPATAQSILRCGFPAVPAALEGTLLSGRSPGRHGRLGEECIEGRPLPEVLPLTAWPELRVHRRDDLWNSLRRYGPASKPALAAVREANEEFGPLIAKANRDHVVLVCGGPPYREHDRRRRIDLSGLTGLADRRAIAEGGILRVVASASHRDDLRNELLRCVGVERVLAGSGLALWGADHPQAGDLVAIAEPGWSFVDEAITYGSQEDVPDTPVLLAFGGEPDWPADVHDVRIAPTLARFLGRSGDGFADSALPL